MDNNNPDSRSIAVITGACGGMGRMCARLLGTRHQLALIDINQAALDQYAKELRHDGYRVVISKAVDISNETDVKALAHDISQIAPFGALIHTAGLSPAQASWQTIMAVNWLGTVYLLDAFEPLISMNSVAVCIASVAGHQDLSNDALHTVLDTPLAHRFMDDIAPFLEAAVLPNDLFGRSSSAYGYSKYAVIRLVEQRAKTWAENGGRIVSVSPGMIATPMGDKELAENALAAGMFEQIPAKRLGTPIDIANAVDFLCSERASYINGTDLRVDYGVTAAIKQL